MLIAKRKEKNNGKEKSKINQILQFQRISRNKIMDVGEFKERSGHNRIRNNSWGYCSYCYTCHRWFSRKNIFTLGNNLRRYKSIVRKSAKNEGQSTVEFAIVAAAFIAITIALGALWQFFNGGSLVDHAVANASHHISDVLSFAVNDIFLY